MSVRPTEKYQPMFCRACRRLIEPDLHLLTRRRRSEAVSSLEDCIYRCDCGISYSNALSEDERALITATPEANVPRQVRAGLAEVLSQVANHRGAESKRIKFCFETSEDAVTWTVFRGLEAQGHLDALPVPGDVDGEATLLLWGAPVSGERSIETAAALATVCRLLGEAPGAFSEPDAIVLWPNLLVLVEAKYRSPNDCQSSHRGFSRYLDRSELFSVTPEEVSSAGYYELTRNWRIGSGLAESLSVPAFLLVNLGPPDLIESSAQAFSTLLAQSSERSFAWCSWNDILESAAPLPPWLDSYASERHRLLYWR